MRSTPAVLEFTSKGERRWDLQSRLFKDRIILLHGPIDSQVADSIVSQILILHNLDHKADIKLLINSPGGEVIHGLAIYDMMQWTTCDLETICIGQACSAASLLLCAGAKGKRSIFKNARVLLHQPWGGIQGTVSDMDIHYQDIQRMKRITTEILHKHSGRELHLLQQDIERDHILYDDEVVEYGVVDRVELHA